MNGLTTGAIGVTGRIARLYLRALLTFPIRDVLRRELECTPRHTQCATRRNFRHVRTGSNHGQPDQAPAKIMNTYKQ